MKMLKGFAFIISFVRCVECVSLCTPSGQPCATICSRLCPLGAGGVSEQRECLQEHLKAGRFPCVVTPASASYVFSACFDERRRTYATLIDIGESPDLIHLNANGDLRLVLSLNETASEETAPNTDRELTAFMSLQSTPLQHTDRLRCSLPASPSPESEQAIVFTYHKNGGYISGSLPAINPGKKTLYLRLPANFPFMPLKDFHQVGLASVEINA